MISYRECVVWEAVRGTKCRDQWLELIASEGQNSRHAEANVEAQSSKPVVLEVEAESPKSAEPNVEFGHSKSF
ncbi:unnamed protein product [Prunus armeniaca]|uniref:Uncharacterized protein n=1 Tax=Prunus armeniaca TaxID=36596 RepID=A0A6J5V345_PRUAR|nr:unnamed protein product [Prunus armeniaca]